MTGEVSDKRKDGRELQELEALEERLQVVSGMPDEEILGRRKN